MKVNEGNLRKIDTYEAMGLQFGNFVNTTVLHNVVINKSVFTVELNLDSR